MNILAIILILDVNRICGKKVIGVEALVLGEVESVKVDTSTWQVTHLSVSLTEDATKELGFKKPFLSKVIIALPITSVSVVGDVITLDKSIKDLKDVIARLDKK